MVKEAFRNGEFSLFSPASIMIENAGQQAPPQQQLQPQLQPPPPTQPSASFIQMVQQQRQASNYRLTPPGAPTIMTNNVTNGPILRTTSGGELNHRFSSKRFCNQEFSHHTNHTVDWWSATAAVDATVSGQPTAAAATEAQCNHHHRPPTATNSSKPDHCNLRQTGSGYSRHHLRSLSDRRRNRSSASWLHCQQPVAATGTSAVPVVCSE